MAGPNPASLPSDPVLARTMRRANVPSQKGASWESMQMWHRWAKLASTSKSSDGVLWAVGGW